ncbi:hypothetical protein [Rhizobium sullae]|uniref:hypothetical protein n=1 Tax=Rhizobium sullae TaxID=50338 RepID=UPI001FCE2971|nr:hypothetical protein [Rhizobium sullae]
MRIDNLDGKTGVANKRRKAIAKVAAQSRLERSASALILSTSTIGGNGGDTFGILTLNTLT